MKAMGLSGFGKSGKTTAADYIEREYGIRRIHIATTLRKMLAEMLRDLGLDEHRIYRHLEGDLKEAVIPEVGKSGRDLQISIGTEWGRCRVNPGLWVDTWSGLVRRMTKDHTTKSVRDHATGRYTSAPVCGSMNDSVRFPNEEEGIRNLGGFTILIARPGTGPISYRWGRVGLYFYERFGLMWGAHDSERTDRLDPDHVIVNDGTLDDLYEQIDAVMNLEGVAKLRAAA